MDLHKARDLAHQAVIKNDEKKIRLLLSIYGNKLLREEGSYIFEPIDNGSRFYRGEVFPFETREMHYSGTLLCAAVKNSSTTIIDLLILAGARLNALDSLGDNPFRIAVRSGNVSAARVLSKNENPESHGASGCGVSTLGLACLSGQPEIVDILINMGANPRAIARNDGSTPLHFAVESGSLACCKLLVDAGASWTRHNHFNISPKDKTHISNSVFSEIDLKSREILAYFKHLETIESPQKKMERIARDSHTGDVVREIRTKIR